MAKESISDPGIAPERARSPDQNEEARCFDTESPGDQEECEGDQQPIDSGEYFYSARARERDDFGDAPTDQGPCRGGVIAVIAPGRLAEMVGQAPHEK